MKHQRHFSPGSKDWTIGCPSLAAWARACRFGDESQQPTWPQVKQSLRCTQSEPEARHSAQPAGVSGSTSWMKLMCGSVVFTIPSCRDPAEGVDQTSQSSGRMGEW
jgi:hypothetical protein